MDDGPELRRILIARTRRVPRWPDTDGAAARPTLLRRFLGAPGDGPTAARQLDVALMAVGCKCSPRLLAHLGDLGPRAAVEAAGVVLLAARELVGDHVQHNAYFRDFPRGVPQTVEFWTDRLVEALVDPASATATWEQVDAGAVNLLELPRYGRYQHSYEELLAAHEPLLASAADRMTVLDLGGSLIDEARAFYVELAAATVPLAEADLALLRSLAERHVDDPVPEGVVLRENRAVVNAVRATHGLPVAVDTTTDVLRLACAMSGGDVTLRTPTRLRSLRRAERRVLLAALDEVVRADPTTLADVGRHREPFKRLGERLHPHEHPRWPSAQDVFAVARGDRVVRTHAARVEAALADGDPDRAVAILAESPGALLRGVDRLARRADAPAGLVDAVERAARTAATPVVLGLREHLMNRAEPAGARLFVNRAGRPWAAEDTRAPLPDALRRALEDVLDREIARRLRPMAHLVVEPAARTIAVPLSDKTRPGGFGVLPRGSTTAVGDAVRFFVHWRQRERTTDYDLSVSLLDESFERTAHVSWTNLQTFGAVHSGDVTDAPDGASEFIDVDLSLLDAAYVVPQIDVYAGEGFDETDEAFFGYMERDPLRGGLPFEPRTVRLRSDLSGSGRVSMPLAFVRGPDGWEARWLHLTLEGRPRFNRVEGSGRSTAAILRAIVPRRSVQIGDLADIARRSGVRVSDEPPEAGADGPLTVVGFREPPHLPPGSEILRPTDVVRLLNVR